MAIIQHSLQDVVAQLDVKMKELEQKRAELAQKVREGKTSEKNDDALRKMNDSLYAAQGAKKLLLDSCCWTQNCDYEVDI